MLKPPRIKSSYAIVDVTSGRLALQRFLKSHAGVPVIIRGVLTDPFGGDDGVSIEFNMDVQSIQVVGP